MMQIERLETIKQQIVTLSPQELTELFRFVTAQQEKDRQPAAVAALPLNEKEAAAHKRQQHVEWMKSHRQEYGGLYVALDGDRLLGTGRNYPEAAAAARQVGVPNAFIDVVLPLDYEGYLGA